LFACLNGIPPYSYDLFQERKIQGISVNLRAGGDIEKSDTSFREESSIVQDSDKVKHSVANFYQVLRFPLFSQVI
jgi:hypothetical protein